MPPATAETVAGGTMSFLMRQPAAVVRRSQEPLGMLPNSFSAVPESGKSAPG